MHTPSSYMYSDLRSFGGITNKEAARELLTDRILCGNGAPRDRINERTFLSRQIVHATPSQVHPEFFGDFHQSAQIITSKIVSNLANPCAYHEIIEHYGGVAAKEMGALLRHYSLDGNLYANAIRRINASPMSETSDKAVLLVMMFDYGMPRRSRNCGKNNAQFHGEEAFIHIFNASANTSATKAHNQIRRQTHKTWANQDR